jgi:hypothetical protein
MKQRESAVKYPTAKARGFCVYLLMKEKLQDRAL